MNVLIGDIGNTITKICLIKINSFKIKKITYFNSSNINSYFLLRKNLKNVLKGKNFCNIALFSSVVPKYQFILKKYLKKNIKLN